MSADPAAGDGVTITVAEERDEGIKDYIETRLREYNSSQSPHHRAAREPGQGPQPLDVYVTDAGGQVVGGLLGFTLFGWLYVDTLWVDESLRGRQVGTRLLAQAEAEAARRGCGHAHLNTFSFQARGFYEKQGYRVVGQMDGYPPGGAFYFLRKDFAESSEPEPDP